MMTSSTVEAVFENGIFRPLISLEFLIREGQHLKISIETTNCPDDILNLATSVYSGLSELQINEIEQIALDRTHFFNQGK
jgi:predicted DNA-binding antitoxin AbrB/MazE fold protein